MPKEKSKQRSLTIYLKELKKGDMVAVVANPSLPVYFPKRIIGQTGTVIGKQGKEYIIEIKQKRKKKFIVHAAHLKKIKAKEF